MSKQASPKLKVFEIAYKGNYHELSDWEIDYIRAKNQTDALRIFVNRHRIKSQYKRRTQDWYWWDGEWYMSFRYIREVDQKPKICPHCHGTGKVIANIER